MTYFTATPTDGLDDPMWRGAGRHMSAYDAFIGWHKTPEAQALLTDASMALDDDLSDIIVSLEAIREEYADAYFYTLPEFADWAVDRAEAAAPSVDSVIAIALAGGVQ